MPPSTVTVCRRTVDRHDTVECGHRDHVAVGVGDVAEAVPAAGGVDAPIGGMRRSDDPLNILDRRRTVDVLGGEGDVPGPIAAKVVVARGRLDRHASRH